MKYKKNNITDNEILREFVFTNRRFVNKALLAKTLECDPTTVQLVMSGDRKDYYGILEAAEKIIKVQL
jgi:hypothetical protein